MMKKIKNNDSDTSKKLFTAFEERMGLTCDVIDLKEEIYGIGLDRSSNTIIYLNFVNGVEQCIGLSEFKGVYVHRVEQNKRSFGKSKEITEFVFIKLLPKSDLAGQISLELFNHKWYPFSMEELELINKWKRIIEENLS
ncbi:hypothetical protein [Indibacter alkaliphilus]|nr:hypothetical protein [Indibacter alkaliphilus]